MLQRRVGTATVKNNSEHPPHSANTVHPEMSANISWLLQNINGNEDVFRIDRSRTDCKTPRRNREVENALVFVTEWAGWCARVASFFRNVYPKEKDDGTDLSSLNDSEVRSIRHSGSAFWIALSDSLDFHSCAAVL